MGLRRLQWGNESRSVTTSTAQRTNGGLSGLREGKSDSLPRETGPSAQTSVPSSSSPSSLCSSPTSSLSRLRASALAVSSARKVTACDVCMASSFPSIWLVIPFHLHSHPAALIYFYYLHRTNAIHLFTRVLQRLQSSVSKPELSTNSAQ